MRIEMQVGIAGRMDVAERAVQARRPVAQPDGARRLEISGLTGLDARIARLRLHQRQPANLELGTRAHDQVGVACARDEARARLDAVRVLQPAGRGVDLGLVAAELRGERAPFGRAREDVQGGPRRRGRRPKQNGEKHFHGAS
jgi:hypothetical protein